MIVGNYPATSLQGLLVSYHTLKAQVKNGLDPIEVKRKEDHNPSVKEFSAVERAIDGNLADVIEINS